jgi:hypothetical protein
MADYYFSASGSDAGAGTQVSPWQTLSKASGLTLNPGDNVYFKRGGTFNGQLVPGNSGNSSNPITYGAWSTGANPILTNNGAEAITFSAKNYLTFDSLDLRTTDTGATGTSGITIGSAGSCSNIVITNNSLTSAKNACIQSSVASSLWLIANNVINGAGDSGIICQGSRHEIAFNTISNTGGNLALSYGKHGIYMKSGGTSFALSSSVHDNTISLFTGGSGISMRLPYARCYNNVVTQSAGGSSSISVFESSTTGGIMWIYNNTIKGVTVGNSGIYIGAADATAGATVTVTDFVIVGNTVKGNGADSCYEFDAEGSTTGYRFPTNIIFKNNGCTGTFTWAVGGFPPDTGKVFDSNYNGYWNNGGTIASASVISWDRTALTYAAWKTATGQDYASKVTNPNLDTNLVPAYGSPWFNGGTTWIDAQPHVRQVRVRRANFVQGCASRHRSARGRLAYCESIWTLLVVGISAGYRCR